ncbi:MAG: glycosyltransferase family 2 protein [Bacteroidales bacterium]|nr:glycosyltransferase family 2 protein [Bacteroidales bacterium]
MENRSVSVIIPCRNEENYISDCLNSFVKSNYPKDNLEVLVVDGESTDQTIAIVNNYSNKYPFVRLINNEKIITPIALNLGVKNACNNYILIASAHSEFPQDYISILINRLKELNADGIGGQLITDVKNKTKKSLSIIKVLSNRFGVGNSLFRIGVDIPTRVDTVPFGLYKKELFMDIGLYNEKLIRNHDIEWSKRLIRTDKKIFLIPDISCKYYARETYKALAKNNFQNGLWNILAVYITKKISSLSIRHFIPLIFVLSIVIPVLLSFFYLPFILISLTLVLAHFILILGISIKLNDKATGIFYLLKAFYTLHLSYGIGSIIGLLRLDKLIT